MEECIKHERELIHDMMGGKRDLRECVESVKDDARLSKVCMKCLEMISYSDIRRQRSALELLGSSDKIKKILCGWDVLYEKYGELVDILLCDDVCRFREYVEKNSIDESMLVGEFEGVGGVKTAYAPIHELGPLCLAMVYGCGKIFECICGMYDVKKCIDSLPLPKRIYVDEFGLLGGSMDILNKLHEYGVVYSTSADEFYCTACNPDIAYWLLCIVNGWEDKSAVTYNQLCNLTCTYNYGAIEKYNLHVVQPFELAMQYGGWLDEDIYALQTVRERCSYSDSELCKLCNGIWMRVIDSGDTRMMKYVNDILHLDVYMHDGHTMDQYRARSGADGDGGHKQTLIEYVITKHSEMLGVFDVDVYELPLDIRAALLLSNNDDLFKLGLSMDDVVGCDCYNELVVYVCDGNTKYNKDRMVRILNRMRKHSVKNARRALQHLYDRYEEKRAMLGVVCNRTRFVVENGEVKNKKNSV